jgi:UDP-2,3-diacylglucosamine hydrolase
MASPSGEAMLSLLKLAQKEASLFVILGDLFDIWVGEGRAFQEEYAPLIAEFQKLKKNSRILYFEGNHDFHLEKFWKEKMGFEVFSGPTKLEFGKIKIWAEHGDEINRQDRGYLALRAFLRLKPVRFFIENIPSRVVFKIGSGASNASRKYTDHKRDPVLEIFREYAQTLRRREDFQLLVTGHTHVPDDFAFKNEDLETRLINLGSWFDGAHFLKVRSSGEIEHVKIS